MTCFQLPDDMCRRLSRRMVDFWWGQVGDRKKVHWTTRQSLCLPQSEEGLGLRDFKLFNRALLASHCWRLLETPNCLLAQILKARYHPTENFLCAVAGSRPSWGWQSLLHGRSLLLRVYADKLEMALPLILCAILGYRGRNRAALLPALVQFILVRVW
ncbi:Uncharacterized mitochondrial protein AtMg00310 [Linum grandiflorum]